MRICILSEFSGKIDEGMRNTAYYLERELAKNHKVVHLCVLPSTNLLNARFWRELFSFKPHIITYVPGPSYKALVFLRFLKLWLPRSKTVVLSSHPFFTPLGRRLIPLVRPDTVLTPYRIADPIFSGTGCKIRFLPNGIDLNKFTPISPQEKQRLRQVHGLDKDKFVALHVGSLDRARNILFLKRLQQMNGTQVMIVGSTSLPQEEEVYNELIAGGCLVWREYLPNVAEVYQLSDCYVFPTLNWRKSMELPVSVLEAMACNLPVVSTSFKALPQCFEEGDGLFFASTEDDLLERFRQVKETRPAIITREKVLPYSWDLIIERLEKIYNELMGDGNG